MDDSEVVAHSGMAEVEFRCMIQDILGNEIYTKDDTGNMADRTIFYCITIPGENEWVRVCPHGDKNEFMTNFKSDSASHNNSLTEQQAGGDQEKNSRLSFSLINWSFPIPSDGKNRSCMIKVYDNNLVEHLRVNDLVQVSGFVEPNEYDDDAQLLTNKNSPKTNGDNNGVDHKEVINDSDFEPASDFPHRLVPRVHVKTLKKLNHINPLLPDVVTRDCLDVIKLKLARSRLESILSTLLGGDKMAAEYIIMSLISGIHRRKDVTNLGQLTVGLMGVKPEMKFLIEKLYEIIAKITTHSHFIDMSIANLNNLRFTPKKDHDNNKMIAGTLQLPDGLYLVLNETALSEGQLNAQGTENLSTLDGIIRWQRHNYNFKYHTVEIDTDLKVLVISEGKSLLNVPYSVKLETGDSNYIDSIRQSCESVNDFLNEELLNMFRYYITALKNVPEYSIPDSVQELIETDFLNWRQKSQSEGKTPFSAQNLSSYMDVARYLTISRGEIALTPEMWRETCQLETRRQARL